MESAFVPTTRLVSQWTPWRRRRKGQRRSAAVYFSYSSTATTKNGCQIMSILTLLDVSSSSSSPCVHLMQNNTQYNTILPHSVKLLSSSQTVKYKELKREFATFHCHRREREREGGEGWIYLFLTTTPRVAHLLDMSPPSLYSTRNTFAQWYFDLLLSPPGSRSSLS